MICFGGDNHQITKQGARALFFDTAFYILRRINIVLKQPDHAHLKPLNRR